MKLSDWLKKEGKTGADLAGAIGCDDTTINRLIPKPGKLQRRKPSIDLAEKIARATNGEVTANDFMDVPNADPASGNAVQSENP